MPSSNIRYRGFYLPGRGKYRQEFVDTEDLNDLPPNPIFVIKINEDGTREKVSEKNNPTPKEEEYIGFARVQLEPKHDGGPTFEELMKVKEARFRG